MARSSSAKNGKNSKNTYRASGSKSSKSSSSGARHNSSASGSKKRMSRLEQRRAQQQNLIRSVVLAGFGILAIALVLVPGQSFWNVLRSWLFGTFGVVTYFVGPFLLYLAYLLASGYHVGTFIGKVLLLAVLLALPLLWAPVSAAVAIAFFADRSIEYSETYAAFQIGVSRVLFPISQALGQADLFGWVWTAFQWVSSVVGFFSALANIWPAIRRILGPEPVAEG